MKTNEPTQNIDKFLGLRNKDQASRLPNGSLVTAENIDIDNTGGAVIRDGFALSFSMSVVTSAFSTQDERRAFVIDAGELFLINQDFTRVSLGTGFTTDYVYWLEVADYIFMSTGHIISKENILSQWEIPFPDPPLISYVGGDLSTGVYQLVITYVDEHGREGGASELITFNALDGEGFTFTPEYNGYNVRAYVSDVNGKVMYLQGVYSSGGVTVTDVSLLTYPIDDAQLKAHPLPDGIPIIGFFESKVWASYFDNGQSVIFFSKEFWWNLFDISNDYLVIPGKVNMLLGTKSGIIIGTDDEIYIYTNDESLVKVADYGVPAGKPYTVDDSETVFIHSNQGLCSLFPFTNLTEDKVSLPAGDACFVELIEQNGFKKVLVLTDGNGTADNTL